MLKAIIHLIHTIFGLVISIIFSLWLFRLYSRDVLLNLTILQISPIIFFVSVTTLSMAASKHFRCVSVVMFIMMSGHLGKGLIFTFEMDLLISGPFRSFPLQAKYLAFSASCYMGVTLNVTSKIASLIYGPLFNINELFNELKDLDKSLANNTREVITRLEHIMNQDQEKDDAEDDDYVYHRSKSSAIGEEGWKEYVKFKRDAIVRCNHMVTVARQNCLQAGERLKRQCIYKTLDDSTSAWIIRALGVVHAPFGLYQDHLFNYTCDLLHVQVDSIFGLEHRLVGGRMITFKAGNMLHEPRNHISVDPIQLSFVSKKIVFPRIRTSSDENYGYDLHVRSTSIKEFCDFAVEYPFQKIKIASNCVSLLDFMLPNTGEMIKNVRKAEEAMESIYNVSLRVRVIPPSSVAYRHPKNLLARFLDEIRRTGSMVSIALASVRIFAGYLGVLLLLQAFKFVNNFYFDPSFFNDKIDPWLIKLNETRLKMGESHVDLEEACKRNKLRRSYGMTPSEWNQLMISWIYDSIEAQEFFEHFLIFL
ncbi:hypothetical protein ACOME3_007942 [Neoechinorhynchus agilis]